MKIISFKKLNIFLLALVLMTACFCVPKKIASADDNYTLTFTDNNGVTKTTMSVAIDGSLTVGDVKAIQDEYYSDLVIKSWIFAVGDNLGTFSTSDLGDDEIVLDNITSDITIYPLKGSTLHNVIFVMPDGTQKVMKVADGGNLEGPVPDGTKFGDRVYYSRSLKNITSDMVVSVSVDSTLKYAFFGGCAALLVSGVILVVIIILKHLSDDPE